MDAILHTVVVLVAFDNNVTAFDNGIIYSSQIGVITSCFSVALWILRRGAQMASYIFRVALTVFFGPDGIALRVSRKSAILMFVNRSVELLHRLVSVHSSSRCSMVGVLGSSQLHFVGVVFITCL